MVSEDGINSGARSFGRLCLAMIPWALGIGFATWLGGWAALHTFRHQLANEARTARYVGSVTPQVSPIKIAIVNHGCVKVDKVDVDGTELLVYSRNDCHEAITYTEYHYQEISPDGTVLHQEYHNEGFCAIPTQPGDKGECKFDISIDDRTETIRVWMGR